jgi:hypothetical protein
MGLWTLALLFQMTSSPQYGDGAGMSGGCAGWVFGSRTVSGMRLAVCVLGSRTGA